MNPTTLTWESLTMARESSMTYLEMMRELNSMKHQLALSALLASTTNAMTSGLLGVPTSLTAAVADLEPLQKQRQELDHHYAGEDAKLRLELLKTPLDEYFGESPWRKPLNEYADPLSTGRKDAAEKYPITVGMKCEWAWSKDCGGGVVPIVGCPGYAAENIHHGPDKNTMNNGPENIHRICAECHNRWHALNDQFYPPRPTFEDGSVNASVAYLPVVDWTTPSLVPASDDEIFDEEKKRRLMPENTDTDETVDTTPVDDHPAEVDPNYGGILAPDTLGPDDDTMKTAEAISGHDYLDLDARSRALTAALEYGAKAGGLVDDEGKPLTVIAVAREFYDFLNGN